jgi:hypothetical protein
VLEAQTRAAAIDALLALLEAAPEAARVDPSRTLVQIGDRLWTIVASHEPRAPGVVEAPSLRRAGAKHKRVR